MNYFLLLYIITYIASNIHHVIKENLLLLQRLRELSADYILEDDMIISLFFYVSGLFPCLHLEIQRKTTHSSDLHV